MWVLHSQRDFKKQNKEKKTQTNKTQTLGSCCNLFGTQTTLLLDSQLLKGVEHIAQRVLCAGYSNNLSVGTLSISPLYMEKSNTIHLSLNLLEMTPSSLQRSCRFEFFISNVGHHLSFFLPTSIFSITHLLCFKNNIWRGKRFYTVLISLLHMSVSFQPVFQKVIITFQVPSQKFTELCCFYTITELWAARKAEQRGSIISLTPLATLLLMQPRMQLAFGAASTRYLVMSSFPPTSPWT